MKQLLTTLALGCFLPFFSTAQTDHQGIALSPSIIHVMNKSLVYCFSGYPPPLSTDCTIQAFNTVGLQMNYWRRFEDEKRPVFVEGRMGLQYFPSKVREIEFTREADDPSVILRQEVAQWNFQSVYLHFSMAGGYRFEVQQWPVRVYAGIFTVLPVWGKRKIQSFSTTYYSYGIVEDPVCQCQVLIKTLLNQPIHETVNQWEEAGLSDQFIDHLAGGLFGIDVDLPLKSKRRFSIGYQYELVLNNPDFRLHRLAGYHNLNLSIGFSKSKRPDDQEPRPQGQNRGFVLGTQADFISYSDGDTKNLLGFDLIFGYNTKKGIRPELKLSRFSQWSGKEAGGVAASGGVAFSMANGYVVPRLGLTFSYWSEWASESYKKATTIYTGAGLQYPNTGRLRMEVSVMARIGPGHTDNSSFRPLAVGYGVHYFFGKS